MTADLDGYQRFYEGTIGLATTMVVSAGPGHGRQAVMVVGNVMLHVFEVLGFAPAAQGHTPAMFERGRLDHFGFTVAEEDGLIALRDRLLAAEATSGDIRRLGPMLSVRFVDPDGFEGEINCLDRSFDDPHDVRVSDQIVESDWFERTQRVLHADHPRKEST